MLCRPLFPIHLPAGVWIAGAALAAAVILVVRLAADYPFALVVGVPLTAVVGVPLVAWRRGWPFREVALLCGATAAVAGVVFTFWGGLAVVPSAILLLVAAAVGPRDRSTRRG